jgi:hypothetical protein
MSDQQLTPAERKEILRIVDGARCDPPNDLLLKELIAELAYLAGRAAGDAIRVAAAELVAAYDDHCAVVEEPYNNARYAAAEDREDAAWDAIRALLKP